MLLALPIVLGVFWVSFGSVAGTPHDVFLITKAAVYVSQRGNTTLPPLLVINATDGSLMNSFGRDIIAADPPSPCVAAWPT